MIDPDVCYAALERRDARFDGLFFTAVKTTRIYCRPVCPARPPLQRNVTFYATAAQAQAAGFRPCLRCRPESAPDSPAWIGSQASVNRALRRIDEGALAEMSVEALADSLGMTGRHLRRLFVQHLGLTPLAIEQARRVHLAKTLLHETRLPMTQIAFAAGFGSLRRFNEAFQALFGRPPTAIRRDAAPATALDADAITLRLSYRPPFDWAERLAARAAALGPGEAVEGAEFRGWIGAAPQEGEVRVRQGPGATLAVEMRGGRVAAIAGVMARIKREFVYPLAAEAEVQKAA
jgi:AraC family transcriptional regulator of adaptative response / DNA-3-methyladenine glycosylase II